MTIELLKKKDNEPVVMALINNALIEETDNSVCINGHDETDEPFEFSFNKNTILNEVHTADQDRYLCANNVTILITQLD